LLNAVAKYSGLALLGVLAVLPHPLLAALANMSGWIIWRRNGRLRKIAVRNLEICFPGLSNAARMRLAQTCLQELSLGILEMGRIWLRRPERLLQRVTAVVGEEHLEAALRDGQGTILLVPHLGSWELVYYYLCQRNTITTMYQVPKSMAFAEFIFRARQRCGVKLVTAGQSGVRVLLKELKSGGIISMLPDQVPAKNCGKFAPFFGEPALTMNLATNLLQRCDSRAVCGYCRRVPGGKYEIVFHRADDAIYDTDCATSLAALNKSIERCVLECPEQYQWQYKRFKWLPGMEKRDYFADDWNATEGLRQRRV
jgi:KDO2-lipid IV(A) lauroyltransferase